MKAGRFPAVRRYYRQR